MKNKVDLLEERIISLNNTLGEIDTNEFNMRVGAKSIINKDKLKTVSDVITHLQKEITENDSILFKDIYRKSFQVEELSPLLDIERLRSEFNISEREMYLMVISNYEEMKKFCKNIKYVKENQNYLELNPIVDSQDKIQKLKPLELRTMDLETKVLQVSNNVDELLKSYNETVNVINEKFGMYNKLLKKFEAI